MCWSVEEREAGEEIRFQCEKEHCEVNSVWQMKTLSALITAQSDSLSDMKDVESC